MLKMTEEHKKDGIEKSVRKNTGGGMSEIKITMSKIKLT
jgi:hypothetical protein